MPPRPKADRVRRTYEFIKAHRKQFPTEVMCRELTVSPATAALVVGQTMLPAPNANPAAGVTPTSSYVSSAPAIASVTVAGVVSVVAPGTATITVTADGTGRGFTSYRNGAGHDDRAAVGSAGVERESDERDAGGRHDAGAGTGAERRGAVVTVAYGYASSSAAVALVSVTGVITAVSPAQRRSR